jgi:hypothetical protein
MGLAGSILLSGGDIHSAMRVLGNLAEMGSWTSAMNGVRQDQEGDRLQRWHVKAHEAFDALWRGEGAPMSHPAAYAWMAKLMGKPRTQCWIHKLDADQCRKLIEAVETLEAMQ